MWERKMCNACNGEDDYKHEDYESPREWEMGYAGPSSYWGWVSYWGRRRHGYWEDDEY